MYREFAERIKSFCIGNLRRKRSLGRELEPLYREFAKRIRALVLGVLEGKKFTNGSFYIEKFKKEREF